MPILVRGLVPLLPLPSQHKLLIRIPLRLPCRHELTPVRLRLPINKIHILSLRNDIPHITVPLLRVLDLIRTMRRRDVPLRLVMGIASTDDEDFGQVRERGEGDGVGASGRLAALGPGSVGGSESGVALDWLGGASFNESVAFLICPRPRLSRHISKTVSSKWTMYETCLPGR